MKASNRYAKGSDYNVIATEGAKHIWPSRRALASHCARLLRRTGQAAEAVYMSVQVVCNPKQNSNKHKTEAYKVGSGIRVRYLPPVAA